MRTRRWQWIQTLASAKDLTTTVSRIGSMTLTIESGVGIQTLHRLLTDVTDLYHQKAKKVLTRTLVIQDEMMQRNLEMNHETQTGEIGMKGDLWVWKEQVETDLKGKAMNEPE